MNTRWLVTIVIVAAAVIAAILLDTVLANHQPAILGLEATPEKVSPSGTCQIACTASDADEDELSYNWSATGGEIDRAGANVTWTAPSSEGSYNITVTVTDGRGGEVMSFVVIEVSENEAPAIADLIADLDWTLPLGSLQVMCDAEDPDEDDLSYEWTVDGGDISGTGAVVNWTAPQEFGVYKITVTVKDGHGSSDTRTLSVIVASEQPAIIEDLVVTAEHCYLKTYSWGYKVGKEQEYHLECILSDTGIEVSYQWSCEDGAISGEGSVVTWIAPDEYIDSTTIAVTVSDFSHNIMDTDSVVFEVVSCSTCTFRC
ncbi:MAG: hypothetical protein PVI95_00225 [Dehalococcoidia bacterium]|jgi:hypothetical protein